MSPRVPIINPIPTKVRGRKKIQYTRRKRVAESSTTRLPSITLAVDGYTTAPSAPPRTESPERTDHSAEYQEVAAHYIKTVESRRRKRTGTATSSQPVSTKRARTPVTVMDGSQDSASRVTIINENTGAQRTLFQPSRGQNTPPKPTPTPSNSTSFSLPFSPPKASNTTNNTARAYKVLTEQGNTYIARTRPSEGYKSIEYNLKIKTEKKREREKVKEESRKAKGSQHHIHIESSKEEDNEPTLSINSGDNSDDEVPPPPTALQELLNTSRSQQTRHTRTTLKNDFNHKFDTQ